MRTSAVVLGVLAAFLAVSAAVYGIVADERAGTVLLATAGPALLLMATSLARAARRPVPLPEDRPDALPADGAGEVAYFPSSSIWPLVLGAGAVVLANALVFGVWLALTGGAVVALAVVGYAVEASSKA